MVLRKLTEAEKTGAEASDFRFENLKLMRYYSTFSNHFLKIVDLSLLT